MTLKRHFISFSCIGVLTTGIHYGLLWLGVEILGQPVVASSAAGQLVGAVVHYLLNYYVTFKACGGHGATLLRYGIVAGVALGINGALLSLLVHSLAWNYWLAQLLATAAVVLWSFVASRHWTFRHVAEIEDRI